MDLLFAQYYNIWPFKDKLININFRNWKYLIKSPIGSGKSFLFFDAPFFALYWTKFRNILNRKSQSWFVRLVFEINEEIYLIERQIKATRTGWESVQSRLFKINWNSEEVLKKVWRSLKNGLNNLKNRLAESEEKILDIQEIKFSKNILSSDFFRFSSKFLALEEIPFKSSTELQKTLNQLLPPKEVFLSTNFLMQDSDNIFEMTPSDRINVFKNIFWLLGIDEAKDVIADTKKEVLAKIKMLSSEEIWKQKFDQIKQNLNLIWSKISKFFEKEDLSLDLFSPWITKPQQVNFEKYFQLIDEKKQIFQTLNTQKESFKKQFKDVEKQISDYTFKIKELKKLIVKLESEIKDFDEDKLKFLREQKRQLLKKQEDLVEDYFTSIDLSKIESITKFEKDINWIYQFTNEIVQQWITQKKEIENLDLQIQNLSQIYKQLEEKLQDLELKPWTVAFEKFEKEKQILKQKNLSEIDKINLNIENFKKQKEDLQIRLEKLQQKYKQLKQILQQETTFECKLIWKNCPFIEQIKGKELKHFKEEVKTVESEIEEITKSIHKICEEIKNSEKQVEILKGKLKLIDTDKSLFKDFFENLEKERQKILNEIEKLDFENKLKIFSQRKEEIQKQIEEKRQILKDLDYPKLKKIYPEFQSITNELKQVDKQILQLENLMQSIEEKKNQILKFQTEIENYNEFLKTLEQQKKTLADEISKLEMQIKVLDIEEYLDFEKNLKEFEKYYIQWQKLYEDYKHSQIEVEKLKEKQKILTDLYNIFSKELMLVVLNDFLPTLFEIINVYLAKVVDFHLNYELKKTKTDKLELEVYVKDDKWERPIKSLSWGQKTVLKLAWILAVAQKIGVKFLFLDETINNLDAEAVWRVADMLQDFVEYNNLKFYVVTHSKQIQEMNIWDDIINVW